MRIREWQAADSCPIIRKMQTPVPLASEPFVRTRLEGCGIGCTAQRLLVGRVLFARDQHLAADAVLALVRSTGARVSKATVYNTLNLFAGRGLLRALRIDADRTVFDSNTTDHHHLLDMTSGELRDVPTGEVAFATLPPLPAGCQAAGVDVVIRIRKIAP